MRRDVTMPNQLAPDSTSILVRMPKQLKARLAEVAKEMNKKYPDANYSSLSIARNAIAARVEEIEKELKK